MKNKADAICKQISFVLLSFLFACNGDKVPASNATDAEHQSSKEDVSNISLDWKDSLVWNYIEHTDREMIRLTRQDTLIHEQWMLDDTLVTDSAIYLVYRIGHDISDANGESLRFVTDQWIYIDSIERKLYEYDIVDERLIVP